MAGSTVARARKWHGRQWLDVPYVSGGHTLQKCDILLPTSGGTPPFRTIIQVHGGGWATGDKALSPGDAPLVCLTNGIAVVSVNYRLVADGVWPIQMHDLKAAIRFLRANAGRYGLNTGRMGSWGQSAGAQMASIAALTPGVSSLRDAALGNANYSESLALCVSWFAPVEAKSVDTDDTAQQAAGGPACGRAPICGTTAQEAVLLGGVGTGINPCTAADAVRDPASVVYWCANGTARPPVRIQHGVVSGGIGGDPQIPIGQPQRYKAALEARGVVFSPGTRYHYSEEPQGIHGLNQTPWNGSAAQDAAVAWIASYL